MRFDGRFLSGLIVKNDLNFSNNTIHERTIIASQLICEKRSFAEAVKE